MRNSLKYLLFLLPIGCAFLVALTFLPPVRARIDNWTAEIQYAINPPEEAVFIPQEQLDEMDLAVSATLAALTGTSVIETALQPSATPSPIGPTPTPTETPTPTLSPTPLPESVRIAGIDYQHQHGLWNYCGPANLAMAVSYWGWETDRLETGSYLRGGTEREDDKNSMPYEMQNFVNDSTGLRMVVRMGGNIDLLKALIAGGFPVIIEKDEVLENVGWLGHYLLISGYDDTKREFYSLDTYRGEGTRYDYDFIVNSWRAFNYTFLVTYPPEKEGALFQILGPFVDETWATNHALEIASGESVSLTGLAQYFAMFNVGTSQVQMQNYGPAAFAFDTAFQLYAGLPSEERPWRMVWYQTGPYFAYYHTGRFLDVINLADTTLDAMKEPILEESFYWRGLAKEMLGDIPGAVQDLQTSIALNSNFGPGWAQLNRIQGGG